jgi:hypothetical protein
MKVESVRRSWLDRVMCVSRRVEVELSCGDRRMVGDGDGVEREGVGSSGSGGSVGVWEESDVGGSDGVGVSKRAEEGRVGVDV